MDFSHVGRNDPCPCGSGKKFKRCHLGREKDIITDRMQMDPGEMGLKILALPDCDHPRAWKMVEGLVFTSPAGKQIQVKFKDLAAYNQLFLYGQKGEDPGPGGVLINPHKTRVLDPTHVYIALSPEADDSTIVHELTHAGDLIEGSALPPGQGQALSRETGVPAELLEHPQEFGERLLELSQRFEVELDAEDEIVAFLAQRQLLFPGKLIAKADKEPLVAAAEKTMRFMKDNQDEINARIKKRQGYMGAK